MQVVEHQSPMINSQIVSGKGELLPNTRHVSRKVEGMSTHGVLFERIRSIVVFRIRKCCVFCIIFLHIITQP